MKHLFFKLLRDIRASKGQYIAITLVILLGVAFYTGVMSASSGVGENIDTFYDNQKLADFWVKIPFADDEILRQIRGLPGVDAADKRAALSGLSGESEFIIHTIPANPTVNKPFLESGRLPNTVECIVDRGYAAVHGLNEGDTLKVTINGEEYALTISGVFNSPEYLYLAKSITESANHKTYGALFVSDGFPNVRFNEITVRAAKDADLTALKADIAKTAIPDGLGVILMREQIFSWIMLDDDINQFGQLGAVFPIIFFFVAAAIIFISMSKNVETQRGQIGNMKALGIRNKTITFHFMSYTLFVCTVGSVLGVILGIFVLMPLVQSIFTRLYTMPELRPAGYLLNVITAVVLAYAFGIAATFLSVRKPLRESPASVMRPKPPRNIKPLLIERNKRLWSKLSYGRKIVLRNLFLNKGRALLSSIGIIGCVGLMLAALSFMDSVNDMLYVKFYEMNNYQINVALQTPSMNAEPPFEYDKESGNIYGVWAAGSVPASFVYNDKTISTDLIALDADCSAILLYDVKGKKLSYPTDGVIIPKLYADKYGLSAGDTIKLTLSPAAGEASIVTVKISGVAAMHLGQDIYTTFKYLDNIDEPMPVSSVYLQMSKDEEATAGELKNDPAVKMVLTLDEIAGVWEQSITIMRAMVYILIAASSVLALAVVYNISAINIFERRRDIATLKVLGYHLREVNRLVFNENLIITGFGSLLGIGAGAAMLLFIVKYIASDEMMVPMVMSPLSVVISIALGFLFTVLANQLLRGKVRDIDMVESLKSVE